MRVSAGARVDGEVQRLTRLAAERAVDGQWALDDGVTGMLIEPDDLGAVRDAVSRLLRDSDLAGSIGEAGRRAVAPYDWKQVAMGVEETYDSAVSPAA